MQQNTTYKINTIISSNGQLDETANAFLEERDNSHNVLCNVYYFPVPIYICNDCYSIIHQSNAVMKNSVPLDQQPHSNNAEIVCDE
jgi:hypothetical protein